MSTSSSVNNSLRLNIVVNTYAEMLALPTRSYTYVVRVNSDTVNNNGNMSEYRIYPDGNIMWQASVNINDI